MSIRSVLIVGGGPAGMTAAVTLARAGIEVHLALVRATFEVMAQPI